MFSPSDAFARYLDAFIRHESLRSLNRSEETVRRELWAAATMDQYCASGSYLVLVDAIGAPVRAANAYRGQILDAIGRISIIRSNNGTRQDALYPLAKAMVLDLWPEHGEGCIKDLQRQLGIGLQHAMTLLDSMEGDILTVLNGDGVRHLV